MTQSPVLEHRPTPTIEDYLATMYVLERDQKEIIAARIAEILEVARPTVTATLKRMERDGWIEQPDRKAIQMTDSGREAARSVIRRHMLTEWILARVLNISWSRIHTEAHHIEHTISDLIEEQMQNNLDSPQTCPHGNPLPGFEHITAKWISLVEAVPGETAIIRRVHEIAEDNTELMTFLESNGILPGVQVEITEVLPFNQTITLKVGDHSVVLGSAAAHYIYIEK